MTRFYVAPARLISHRHDSKYVGIGLQFGPLTENLFELFLYLVDVSDARCWPR